MNEVFVFCEIFDKELAYLDNNQTGFNVICLSAVIVSSKNFQSIF